MTSADMVLRFIRLLCFFLIALIVFLMSAFYAGVTGNEIADTIAILSFTALLIMAVELLGPWLFKIFPHGIGHQRDVQGVNPDEVVMAYPRIYKKVPFGLLAIIFVVVAYIAHVRSSLPVVQARGVEQEAVEVTLMFVGASVLFGWALFVWAYSADYRFNSEGFFWAAPWSRKRFVRWDEIRSVWYVPWLGMGIWLKTDKGRFRIDYDMENAWLFIKCVKTQEVVGVGLDKL